jgi:hypothetical protein
MLKPVDASASMPCRPSISLTDAGSKDCSITTCIGRLCPESQVPEDICRRLISLSENAEGVNGRSNPECSAEVAEDNEQDAPLKIMEAKEEIKGRPPEKGKKGKRE